MNDGPLILERTYPVPVTEVWKALTDKNQMKDWYFDLAEFKVEPGFEFQFYGGTPQNQYLHLCRITEVRPLQLLAYTWQYDGYPGKSEVRFELFREESGTKVKLTHSGLGSFPAENSDFDRKNFQEGWTAILGQSLAEFLQKAGT